MKVYIVWWIGAWNEKYLEKVFTSKKSAQNYLDELHEKVDQNDEDVRNEYEIEEVWVEE